MTEIAPPLVVVDVGASGGVDLGWRALPNDALVLAFEPDEEECERLSRLAPGTSGPRVEYVPLALGRERTRAPFYETHRAYCSSNLRPMQEMWERFPSLAAMALESVSEIELVPLDEWCRDRGVNHIDFIKLDTQGSELDILHGARQILNSTLIVEIEVEFNPLYENQPLFGDVDAHLRSRGFELWTLDSVNFCELAGSEGRSTPLVTEGAGHALSRLRPAGQLMWAQAFYVRGDLLRLDDGTALATKRTRAFALAQTRGLSDLADALALVAGLDPSPIPSSTAIETDTEPSQSVEEIRAELTRVREELQRIYASRSYRATQPLRSLRSRLSRKRS